MEFLGIKSVDDLLQRCATWEMSDITEDMTNVFRPTRLTPAIRKELNKAIYKFTTSSDNNNKKFESIPIDEIMKTLEELGYTVLQEDGTPFSGIFTGNEGRATLPLGAIQRDGSYSMVTNSKIVITWYKVSNDFWYEITTYIS